MGAMHGGASATVSYTHLDVYKRQRWEYTTLGQPSRRYLHGRVMENFTYHADGMLAIIHDVNNNAMTLTNWKRGIPKTIQHPPTPEAPAGAVESAVVNDSCWILSLIHI